MKFRFVCGHKMYLLTMMGRFYYTGSGIFQWITITVVVVVVIIVIDFLFWPSYRPNSVTFYYSLFSLF